MPKNEIRIPRGWKTLNIGEIIRDGDFFYNDDGWKIYENMIGCCFAVGMPASITPDYSRGDSKVVVWLEATETTTKEPAHTVKNTVQEYLRRVLDKG